MISATRFTRRTAIGCAIGAGILAWAPPTLAARRKDEETWESEDGSLAVTYDPGIWFDLDMALPGVDQVTIATDPTFGNDRYWLQVGESSASWASVEEAEATAMNAYFSQGMGDSIIFDQYSTETAFGWVHYADFQGGPRTVNVIQYAMTNDGAWYEVMHSIDAGALDDLDINDVFEAVSLNNDSVFVIASQKTLIRAIKDAFAA